MSGANQSLSEFVGFLSSPDMYGSMSSAASMMAWLLNLVVFVLMVASVIGVAFIVFKFACDIVFLSGLGHMMNGGKMGQFVDKFASESAKNSDIMGYLKTDVWKLIITLAFVGILASGMALPIAGQVAGAAGAMIGKLVGLDVAGKIEDFSYEDFQASMEILDPDSKKAEYDLNVQEARTYLNQIYELSNSTETQGKDSVELQQKIDLYKIAIMQAHLVANSTGPDDEDTDTSSGYYSQHLNAPVCNQTILGITSSQEVVDVECNSNT